METLSPFVSHKKKNLFVLCYSNLEWKTMQLRDWLALVSLLLSTNHVNCIPNPTLCHKQVEFLCKLL